MGPGQKPLRPFFHVAAQIIIDTCNTFSLSVTNNHLRYVTRKSTELKTGLEVYIKYFCAQLS